MSSVWPSSSSSSSKWATLENSASFEALRCLTKSTMPPLYWYVTGLLALGPLVVEDDLEALVEERHRLQPLEHGAGDELGALGDEDRRDPART